MINILHHDVNSGMFLTLANVFIRRMLNASPVR